MPFDSNGRFSLAPGYLGVTGQTILTSQHNPPLEDIASGLSVTLLRTGVAPMLANLPMGGFKMTGLASGTAATDAVSKSQLDGAAPPVGAVIDYAGSTAPAGWLLCYGQAISRSSYAALFSAIGATYGAGDGSTTFNLPDCRGRVAAGKDDMGGSAAGRLTGPVIGSIGGTILGNTGGEQAHTITISETAPHAHGGATGVGAGTAISFNNVVQNLAGTSSFAGGGAAGFANLSVPFNTHTHPITAEGGGVAHNNVQPTIIFNKIIRSGV